MKVGTFFRWPGAVVAKRRASAKLNGRQREATTELQQVWVRTALHVVSADGPTPLVFGITSAIPGEGKTTNSLGISSALASETNARVVLMEFDIANPGLASHVGARPRPGLVEHVTSDRSLESLARSTSLLNLDIVLAGGEADNGVDLENPSQLSLSKLRQSLSSILASMKERYAYIILDMPPILTNPYAKEMCRQIDGSFLTVRGGVTPTESLKRTVDEMGSENLSGVILVGACSRVPTFLVHLLSESE